jgi:hypothetical protein
LAVNCTGSDELLPNVTLPKLSEVVLAVRLPTAVTPVPLTAIFDGEFVASLKIVRVPVTGPDTVGANVTLNDALCPTASVSGSPGPVTVNPEPTIVA